MSGTRIMIGYALIFALLLSAIAPAIAATSTSVNVENSLVAKAEALKFILERALNLGLPADLQKEIKMLIEVNVTRLNAQQLEEYIARAVAVLKQVNDYILRHAVNATVSVSLNTTLAELKRLVLERLELLAKKLHINITKDMVLKIEKAKSIEEVLEAAREVRDELMALAASEALNATIATLNITVANPRQAILLAATTLAKTASILETIYTQLLGKADPQALVALRLVLSEILNAKEKLVELTLNTTLNAGNATRTGNMTLMVIHELENMKKRLESLLEKNTTRMSVERLLAKIEELEDLVKKNGVTPALLVEIEILKQNLSMIEELVGKATAVKERIESLRKEILNLLNTTKNKEVTKFAKRLLSLLDKAEAKLEKGAIIEAARLLGEVEEGITILKTLESRTSSIASAIEKKIAKLEAKLEALKKAVEKIGGFTRLIIEELIKNAKKMVEEAKKAIAKGDEKLAETILSALEKVLGRIELLAKGVSKHENTTRQGHKHPEMHENQEEHAHKGHTRTENMTRQCSSCNETLKEHHTEHNRTRYVHSTRNETNTTNANVTRHHPSRHHPEPREKHGKNYTRVSQRNATNTTARSNATRTGKGEHRSGNQTRAGNEKGTSRNEMNKTRSEHKGREKKGANETRAKESNATSTRGSHKSKAERGNETRNGTRQGAPEQKQGRVRQASNATKEEQRQRGNATNESGRGNATRKGESREQCREQKGNATRQGGSHTSNATSSRNCTRNQSGHKESGSNPTASHVGRAESFERIVEALNERRVAKIEAKLLE